MTAALLLGAGFGLGLLSVIRGLFPPRPSLAEALARLTQTAASATAQTAQGDARDPGGWTSRLGKPFVPVLVGLGLPAGSLRADLVVLDRPPERLLAEKATAALVGLLLAPATTVLLAAGGLVLPWQIPVWSALALAVLAFVFPDWAVRTEAAKRRAEFRHALGAFLDLVVIALAGGAGVEAALANSANAGQGWAFDRIRRALATAELTRQPPWQSLGDLGRALDVPELVELAASVSLAGTEGAKIRASLTAKAAGLRAHQLTDAEAKAQAATERLSLPLILLFAGFLLLLGFPAVASVLVDFYKQRRTPCMFPRSCFSRWSPRPLPTE